MNFLNRIVFILVMSVLFWNCTDGNSDNIVDDNNEEPQEKIYITDQTGKRWDVTHAVSEYGFDAENFQYGLGPYAIRPINDPEMISPGEPGYPDKNSAETVIGLNINGDARAYPIRTMKSHEVANDRVGGKHVAVVY